MDFISEVSFKVKLRGNHPMVGGANEIAMDSKQVKI